RPSTVGRHRGGPHADGAGGPGAVRRGGGRYRAAQRRHRQPDHQLPAQEPRRRRGCASPAVEDGPPGLRRSDSAWRGRLGAGGAYRKYVVGAGAMTSRPLRVGVVGLGTTGAAAARSLLQDAQPDLALTVYDRDPARCEPFRGAATLAASAREALHESDLVVLALPGEREIDRTLDRFSDGRVG